MWVNRSGGPTGKDGSATALGVAPDGTKVFVTGQSLLDPSHSVYATVAYDAHTGATLGVMRYMAPEDLNSATALRVSPDASELFVTGESGLQTGSDYATAAYDTSTGARLWTKRYNGPGNLDDVPTSLGVGPTSEILITGASPGQRSESDFATVAYAAG